MCIMPKVKKCEKTFALNVDIFKKKNLISQQLHEKSVYSIMIVQENETEDHEF